MVFYENGTLTTDKRTIDDAQTWDTQTDWEAYQSKTNIQIANGVVKLSELNIPASTFGWYAADELSLNDQDSVTSWPDSWTSGNDLSGGSPTYVTNQINGLPVVSFDGTDDVLDDGGSSGTSTQPNTYLMVVENVVTSTAIQYIIDSFETTGDRNRFLWSGANDEWFMGAGTGFAVPNNNPSEANPIILSAIFDGADSELRLNGSVIGTGDVGNQALLGLSIGSSDNTTAYGEFDLGELLACNADLRATGELAAQEQRLADKWGITL